MYVHGEGSHYNLEHYFFIGVNHINDTFLIKNESRNKNKEQEQGTRTRNKNKEQEKGTRKRNKNKETEQETITRNKKKIGFPPVEMNFFQSTEGNIRCYYYLFGLKFRQIQANSGHNLKRRYILVQSFSSPESKLSLQTLVIIF